MTEEDEATPAQPKDGIKLNLRTPEDVEELGEEENTKGCGICGSGCGSGC
jgi:hypothetical protein